LLRRPFPIDLINKEMCLGIRVDCKEHKEKNQPDSHGHRDVNIECQSNTEWNRFYFTQVH
jgi:hypothetical protein